MAFDANALVQAVKDNMTLLKVSGIGLLVSIFMLIVIGVLDGEIDASNITVDATTASNIDTIITSAGTIFTTGVGVFTTLFGFVVVVALLRAFGIDLSLGGNRS